MIKYAISFFNVVLAGLLAGAVVVILIGYDPSGFSFEAYRQLQQGAIRSLNTLLPVAGFITILLTGVNAALHRDQRGHCILLIVAALLLIASAIITRTGNQPINAVIMTWGEGQPAAGWEDLQAKWLRFHEYRTILSTLAFLAITFTVIRPNRTV